MKDALDDVLAAALPDEQPDGAVRQHGAVRDGAFLRDDADAPGDVVKRRRRHLDQHGERQLPQGGQVRPDVEDVVAGQRHARREEHGRGPDFISLVEKSDNILKSTLINRMQFQQVALVLHFCLFSFLNWQHC